MKVCFCAVAALAAGAGAQVMTATRVASGLQSPLFAGHAPDDYRRLYIVERAGTVEVLDLQAMTLNAQPFLVIQEAVYLQGESGFLGLAFHPGFRDNGYYYVNYNRQSDRATVIARYTASDADHGQSEPVVVAIYARNPNGNFHRGGWLGFGPDGYMYMSFGDDQNMGNGQSILTPHGKINRIDVDGPDAFPEDPNRNFAIPPGNPFIGQTPFEEIWLWGLRNPYRCSHDRATGDFYIGEVGADAWEEIDWIAAGDPGPRNYGWADTEGPFDPAEHPDFTNPLHAWPHLAGNAAIGGYVYRGAAMPKMHGTYFFADITARRLYSFVNEGGTVTEFHDWTDELTPTNALRSMASFGEDLYGELYVTDLNGGRLYKLHPPQFVSDCDGDLIEDASEISAGEESDCNANGTPDDCEPDFCPADLAPPYGTLNVFDFLAFQNAFGSEDACADLAAPFGNLNVFDFLEFQTVFGEGC